MKIDGVKFVDWDEGLALQRANNERLARLLGLTYEEYMARPGRVTLSVGCSSAPAEMNPDKDGA